MQIWERAARTSVALDKMVEIHKLGALAYYYQGTGNAENEDVISSYHSRCQSADRSGDSCGRGNMKIKNAQAMKIMDGFCLRADPSPNITRWISTMTCILMGHDGPGHFAIAEGEDQGYPCAPCTVTVKRGHGLSVEMSVKHGPVTLLSVVQTVDGKLQLLTAQGESQCRVRSWKLAKHSNSRYRFLPARAQLYE